MRVYNLILVFLCLIMTNISYADPLPQKMQGLWALPDCRAPERYAYHSAEHVLYITDKKAKLKKVSFQKTGQNYQIVSVDDVSYPFKTHEDGILEIAILAPGHTLNTSLPWEDLPIDQRNEYTKCAQDIPSPHNIAKTALPTLDLLEQHCTAQTNASCQATLFNAIDQNSNGTLNTDEVKLAHMQMLYLDVLLKSSDSVSNNSIRSLLRNQITPVRYYSESLTSKYANAVSLSDLKQHPWSNGASIHTYKITEAQKRLLQRFPALRKSLRQ